MIGSIKWLIRRVSDIINHIQHLSTPDKAGLSRPIHMSYLSSRHMTRYECLCPDSSRQLIGNTNVITSPSNLNPSTASHCLGDKTQKL